MRRGFALLTVLATSSAAFFALNCSSDAVEAPSSATPDGAVADTTAPSDDGSSPANDSSTSDSGGDCPAGYDDFIPAAAGCETKNPLGLDKNALGLWLTGDRGLACASGKITSWTDQSGHARNAMPIAGHRAPLCNCYVGDASVAHFGAESVDAATPVDAGRWDDDTLSVDLSFLANTAYTIIAVDRRHFPGKDYSFFIGTGVPSFDDYGPNNTDRGLHVGYRFDGTFWFDQFNNPTSTSVFGVDAGDGGSNPLAFTMALNPGTGDAGNLRVLRSDWSGAFGAYGDAGTASKMPAAAEGRIGRGFGNTNLDTRFRGDLAEIIVFTRALTDAELAEMKEYLQRHWGLY